MSDTFMKRPRPLSLLYRPDRLSLLILWHVLLPLADVCAVIAPLESTLTMTFVLVVKFASVAVAVGELVDAFDEVVIEKLALEGGRVFEGIERVVVLLIV